MPADELALTIGFFDGVHAGHRYLVDYLCQVARREALRPAILTFWPHPRMVLHETYQPKLLNTIDEKCTLFGSLPIDFCVMIPFTIELSQYSASDFMRRVLKEQLHVRHLIIGYDHRFGHNREEGFEDYKEYGGQMGMTVDQAPVYGPDGQHVSSSSIRRMIDGGEQLSLANHCLGYAYSISGEVVRGRRIGRTMGFPTANVRPESANKVMPAIGSYAVRVEVDGVWHDGMGCVSTRPTFEADGQPAIEVHLFDFCGDLYGKTVRVEFVGFIRHQERFSSAAQLGAALSNDKVCAAQILASGENGFPHPF